MKLGARKPRKGRFPHGRLRMTIRMVLMMALLPRRFGAGVGYSARRTASGELIRFPAPYARVRKLPSRVFASAHGSCWPATVRCPGERGAWRNSHLPRRSGRACRPELNGRPARRRSIPAGARALAPVRGCGIGRTRSRCLPTHGVVRAYNGGSTVEDRKRASGSTVIRRAGSAGGRSMPGGPSSLRETAICTADHGERY